MQIKPRTHIHVYSLIHADKATYSYALADYGLPDSVSEKNAIGVGIAAGISSVLNQY